jgi:hypothetical protein
MCEELIAKSAASAGYDARCSKCNSQNIKTGYVGEGELVASSSQMKVDNEFVRSSEYDYFFKLTAKTEHLSKKCECGYSWRERVAS